MKGVKRLLGQKARLSGARAQCVLAAFDGSGSTLEPATLHTGVMLYVIKLSTEDGTHVGFLERGKAVPLRQATVYDSPSSAEKAEYDARRQRLE